MRTKIKIKIIAILLCIIGGITLICSQMPTFAKASTFVDIAALEEYAAELNQTLTDNNTTADEQLELLSDKLEAQINQTTDSTQSNNLATMRRFTNDLYACSMVTYSLGDDIANILLDTVLVSLNEASRIAVLDLLWPMFAVLQMLGHDLTIELLVRALLVQSAAETYVPTYGYKIKQSELFKSIANGSATTGSEDFPNATFGTDGDLYLAIHSFDFIKPYSSSKTVTITDTYDYNDSEEQLNRFPWIFRPVIKGMCALNRAGLLTFYEIEITEAVSEASAETLHINENYGYSEVRPYVHANELKDYEVSFSSKGRRLFQTFGSSQTALYVLDENGAPLASASSNGFNGNSLLSYDFEKNKKYILRVKHSDKTAEGDIKLTLISDTRNASSFSGLNLPTIDAGNYTASATAHNVYMAKIVPAATKRYKITFTTNALFRAFFIDMSSVEVYHGAYCTSISGTNGIGGGMNGTLSLRDPVEIIIGGGGGGDSNVIGQNLKKGKQYLLIVCGCPANSSNLNVQFSIQKS